jgi:predicted DNA-binding transcriptional regulator YafY
MDTIIRHWHILRMIPRFPRRIEVGSIYTKLQAIEPAFTTTRRTIERDLHTLSAVFPLEPDGLKPQGWRWRHEIDGLDVPGMDLTTALTFRMIELHTGRMFPGTTLSALAPHFAHAKAVLGDINAGGLAAWPEKVKVVPRSQPLVPPKINSEVMDVVYESLLRNRRFNGTYRPQGEKGREYEVNPLGLVFNDPVVYLVATCWDYTDVRLLALHRFTVANMLGKTVTVPSGFDLQKYIEAGGLGFAHRLGRTIQLRVLFSKGAATHLRESPLTRKQTMVSQPDGRVLVEAEVPDTDQLRWWLLGFGEQAEVIGPEEMRKEIAAKVKKLGVLYGTNTP